MLMGGKTLTEAFVEDYFSVPEEEFAEAAEYFTAEVAELLAELGIPVPARSTADLDWPETIVDPEDVYAELYDAELERRGLSNASFEKGRTG